MSEKQTTVTEKINTKPLGFAALIIGIAFTATGIFVGVNLNGLLCAVILSAPGVGLALAGLLILRGALESSKDESDSE